MRKNKLIIFDLDGTLYKFRGGSFINSGLQKIVLQNASQYIQIKLHKTEKDASVLLKNIQKLYGENISIALEKKYNCSRREYFDFVWNIDAKGLIVGSSKMKNVLNRLSKKYQLLLISDAAFVWIENALKELELESFFEGKILSGDGNKRKIFENRFVDIPKQYNVLPENIISIGDQEKTDILPAKKIGFKTIYVKGVKESSVADENIDAVEECEKIIDLFFYQRN
ncbi:MAG: HAD family hydrolase [Patescibacteria group bacterium]|nr:HAD family hydrolase [Patescibacteria group bacterium]